MKLSFFAAFGKAGTNKTEVYIIFKYFCLKLRKYGEVVICGGLNNNKSD
jgi:hypothetical protein